MPTDKQSNLRASKPITPALSSRFRSAKTSSVPRLAASVPTSPAVNAKRELRTQVVSPIEDISAVSLSGNVTPRSGARSSRIGAESPNTPATIPRPSASACAPPSLNGGTAATTGTRLTASSVPNFPRRASGGSTFSKKDDESLKFFRAGESKSSVTYAEHIMYPRPLVVGYVRANDGQAKDTIKLPTSSVSQNTAEKEEKFFRANDVPLNPDARVIRPTLSPQSTLHRPRSPEVIRDKMPPLPQMSPIKAMFLSRPSSPVKQPAFSGRSAIVSDWPADRRNSIGSDSSISKQNHINGHKKSASISTMTTPFTPFQLLRQESEPSWDLQSTMQHLQSTPNELVTPDTLSPRSTSLASSKTLGTASTNGTDISDLVKATIGASWMHTEATREATNSALPAPSQVQINAANARRERKVLDLEISNSSLLAINKTLERELKKQNSELRRYRRLSRSGRLSFAPSNRSMSGQSALSILSEQIESDDPAETSESDENGEVDDLSDEGTSSLSDEFGSDGTIARARRRRKDERRLMLDLSKHQQILIDSQKLTQSIRKCLSLTEDLIKDGRRALEYSVGIGDVKLGGRVLGADDLEADTTHPDTNVEGKRLDHQPEPRRGLLSPSLTKTELEEAALWLETAQNLDRSAIVQSRPKPNVPEPG